MTKQIETINTSEALVTDASVAAPEAVPVDQEVDVEEAKAAAKAGRLALAYEVLETVILAVVIWLAVNFATARFIVEGSSMEPNFHTGQMLIVSRLTYMLDEPKRGDVIVFQFPGNLADDYIKRIIGVPGDEVVIEDGKVYVNGVQLTEPYISSDPGFNHQTGRWTVPANNYFVMGDNRGHSSDSRSWGMLPREDIIGKAWLAYWPPSDWGIIKHYRIRNIPVGASND